MFKRVLNNALLTTKKPDSKTFSRSLSTIHKIFWSIEKCCGKKLDLEFSCNQRKPYLFQTSVFYIFTINDHLIYKTNNVTLLETDVWHYNTDNLLLGNCNCYSIVSTWQLGQQAFLAILRKWDKKREARLNKLTK